MTDKKPAGMSWEGFAELKIRSAMEQGEFEKLPGRGKPISGADVPYRDDWWLRKFLQREELAVPCGSLEIRRDVEQTLERMGRMSSESEVRRAVMQLNQQIAKVNRSTTTGPATSV